MYGRNAIGQARNDCRTMLYKLLCEKDGHLTPADIGHCLPGCCAQPVKAGIIAGKLWQVFLYGIDRLLILFRSPDVIDLMLSCSLRVNGLGVAGLPDLTKGIRVS